MVDRMESPFDWDISEKLMENFDESELHNEEEVPLMNLMNNLILAYVYVLKHNYNKARKSVKIADDIYNCDKEKIKKENICKDVVRYVVQATKYRVLALIKDNVDDDIDEEIVVPSNLTLINSSGPRGTLNGCKCVAFSALFDYTKAVQYAEMAITDSPDCPLWHFILGKNLRRIRRSEWFLFLASPKEISCFETAYNTSKISYVLYGIYLVQTYEESRDFTSARSLAVTIQQLYPTNLKVQLRLARHLIKAKSFGDAKVSLDYVKDGGLESDMFFHQMGIYHMKLKEYKVAADYLKKTAKDNFGAILQYGQCMKIIDEDFSILFHLFLMLKTFKKHNNQQQLLILVGLEYHHKENYEKSLSYMVRGIRINPRSPRLMSFVRIDNIIVNIFKLIGDEILPMLKEKTEGISSKDIIEYDTLRKMALSKEQAISTST